MPNPYKGWNFFEVDARVVGGVEGQRVICLLSPQIIATTPVVDSVRFLLAYPGNPYQTKKVALSIGAPKVLIGRQKTLYQIMAWGEYPLKHKTIKI